MLAVPKPRCQQACVPSIDSRTESVFLPLLASKCCHAPGSMILLCIFQASRTASLNLWPELLNPQLFLLWPPFLPGTTVIPLGFHWVHNLLPYSTFLSLIPRARPLYKVRLHLQIVGIWVCMFGGHVVTCAAPPDLIILKCNGQGDGEALGGISWWFKSRHWSLFLLL